MIKNAEISKTTKGGGVSVGKTVTVENTETGVKQEFQIVGQSEADPAARKISLDSPIGAALKGKKEGDTVTVDLPVGEVEFRIVKIG
ncbi:MAG: Transcription elongation factor GreA [candidate division WS6 bacterium OLB20]|uniref:Transcription elongation factor GreA n=1 Tax=candidate division WS6 bacterium OLB20 TaxID=1617426 RepID=A0A136LX41_9BACT|nr:MAG: Transcription elongation factor GreA [candidate division WS6 bacterium OLB20]